MTVTFPENVKLIFDIFSRHGFEAYAVGGCVRDSLMGRVPYDWDITSSSPPEKTLEIFESEGFRVIPTGLRHGTVSVLIDGVVYECTTYRTEKGYSDSRHPDLVEFTSNLSDDLCRRDFTVNAMACGADGKIIDLYGGMEDLEKKTVRCVGNSWERFCEDALRILRAVRFAAKLGFRIEQNTKGSAKKLAPRLKNISDERKSAELRKILESDNADYGIKLLFDLGLMKFIIPDLCSAPSISLDALPKKFEIRMAALIGRDASIDLSALRLSRKCSDDIKKLCEKISVTRDSVGARRLLQSFGELAEDVCILDGDEEFAALVSSEREKSPPLSISSLAIGGKDVQSLGIEGKEIGRALAFLLEKVIVDPSQNQRDILISELLHNYS